MSVHFVTETAETYRAMAKDCHRRSAESFDRCDTDGYLSQWAADMSARRYGVMAKVAENGGKTEEAALFFADGTIASHDMREGKFGAYFFLTDEAAKRYGSRFVNLSNAKKAETRRKNYAKKGFTYGRVKGDAVVMSGGNGYNISYYPVIKNGAEVEVISTDDCGTDHDW